MVTRHALVVAAAALTLVACQSQDTGTPRSQSGSSSTGDAQQFASSDADLVEERIDAGAKPDEPEAPDPGTLIDDLGAVPAWQAVVDRSQYLARRGQHGVVFGTLGEIISTPVPDAGVQPTPYTWLVDDTEGNGALAIRVLLDKRADAVKAGERVALGGAWILDADRRYYWKVDELTKLPPAPPSDLKDTPVTPGHDPISAPLPPGARTISVAQDNDIVYFMVIGRPPAIDGDGWPVGDALGTPVRALLNLPGERPSFGAQDFRTPDERWRLKRATVYWVRIGKVRRPNGPDKPAVINARTAPVKMQ
jgi:hypothetical protein